MSFGDAIRSAAVDDPWLFMRVSLWFGIFIGVTAEKLFSAMDLMAKKWAEDYTNGDA